MVSAALSGLATCRRLIELCYPLSDLSLVVGLISPLHHGSLFFASANISIHFFPIALVT